MSTPKRVVVLARPGNARDRTEAAILAAGAEVAELLDPGVATEADVRSIAPDAVLVILDPAVEQILQRFDGVFGDPSLEIMFEDADVAAKRDGWEAARWARHLNAKLYGHEDVLPRTSGLVLPPFEPAVQTTKAEEARFRIEMEALQAKVAALPELPHGKPVAAAKTGAVVIAAGIGGPDAVRQLLGGLPSGFARPIVLRQRIEGGQYDKLVRQMQRVTPLRVLLAQAGDLLQAGTVHVLPDGLDVQFAPAGLVFAPVDAHPSFPALLPADSAMLLLSGADQGLVDRAMVLSLAGALVLAQSNENCFDPAASNALVARGGTAVSIAKLSVKLLERWPA